MKFIKKLIFYYKKSHNIQSPDQAEIIACEVKTIVEMAATESTEDYRRESRWKSDHDGKCPLCGSTNIVNKITRVQGHGEVHGSFSLGFGSVYGSTDIDTNDVNHCSSCGNQWKKYKINYNSNSKTLANYLNNIENHIEGKYTYGDKNYEKLKHFKAETIYNLIGSNHVYRSDLNQATKYLDIRTLREYFKSVFDYE